MIAGLALTGTARADVALQSGVATPVPLGAAQPATNFYIDVNSASAQQLNVSASGGTADVDLFLRYGSPFPMQDTSVPYSTVDWDLLDRAAQYHSISSSSSESIQVLRSSRFPLQNGRWYIAVINGSSAPVTTNLTATISNAAPVGSLAIDFLHPRTDATDPTNDCDDSFWTDSTPATPVGGNNGTTLGQQRKNALTYATQQLVQQLQIPTTLNVHACGAHLAGDSNSAILAHAGPTSYFFDEPKFPINALPKKYTWYPAAAAARQNGTSLCGVVGGPCDEESNAELEITFNEDIGQSTVIGGENFYLGFDADPSQSSLDFITIAMHEMTHGLGFFGLANTDSAQGPIGAKAGINTQQNTIAYGDVDDGPYDDIYDDSVAEVNGSTYTPFMGYEVIGAGDAARAAALVSGPTVTSAGTYNPGIYTGLRWLDPAATASSVNIHHAESAPNDFPSLYAPCDKSKTTTCATQPASTLAHTVQANDMMNAYYSRFNLRQMGLAVPMLGPVGWSNAATTPPTLAQPIPSNWFDNTHSGHGFDFQLGYHDAAGDVYFLTFYTYAADGTPEWYQAYGHVIDGVFTPTLQQNGGTLYRIRYSANTLGNLNAIPDPSVVGSVVVDFNQAANSPACRNTDRSGSLNLLGVMRWSIGSETGSWCVEPLTTPAESASPDYNGHWYAPSDSGWGFELLDVDQGGATPNIYAYVYYPGPDNQPTWAFASGTLSNGGTGTLQLQQVSNGFCRSCAPPAQLNTTTIGSMAITLDPIAAGSALRTGKASLQANYAGGGSFARSNDPITLLSLPAGP